MNGAVLVQTPRPATRDRMFERALRRSTIWLPELGMGYHPVRNEDLPYDADYWAKYERYAATEMGRRITAARVGLVDSWTTGEVLDIGIGCGAFIEARLAAGHRTLGFDVNPVGIRWLKERELYRNPYRKDIETEALTLWDALEHVEDPGLLVSRASRFVFAALPVVRDSLDLGWKHYRRDEHRWYWTRDGFVGWMRAQGFGLRHESNIEVQLGREDIGTFVFERMREAA